MNISPNQKTNLFKAWLISSRPKTLFVSSSAVILGTAYSWWAYHIFFWEIFLLTLLCAMGLQVSSNLINDFFDYKKGVDHGERLGPLRGIHLKMLTQSQLLWGIWILNVVILFMGVYLMIHGGSLIIVIGFCSILFAYLYTGGPFPLSHWGLGELFAFVFFGPIALIGTAYLQSHVIDTPTMLLGSTVGFLSAQIMAINNLRDIHSDQKVNKKTLAVIFGERFQRKLIFVFLTLSVISTTLCAIRIGRYQLIFAEILTLVFIKVWYGLWKAPISPLLNQYLGKTALYLFLKCLILSIFFLYFYDSIPMTP
jgi:1,4-dihydroxy-2-naphthoate polyprenyltransferase